MSSKPETPAWLHPGGDTTWPRPALESDEHFGPAWRARHAPGSLTLGDLMYLASVADAYEALVTEPSAAKYLPKIRALLRQEGATL